MKHAGGVRHPSRRWFASAIPPALYALCALALFGGILPVMGHSWIGIDADAKQVVYWLDLVANAVRHGHDPLLTDAIQAPSGVNLMWNTSMVLPSIVLTPLTLLAGPYASYDVLIMAAPVLSAWAAHAAVHRYVASAAAAWLGGLVFGFSPALLAETLGHAQTAMAWFAPVALLLVDEAVVRRRWPLWRVGVALGVATAVQVLTGEETALATVVLIACLLGVLAVQHPGHVRLAARRLGVMTAVAGCTALVLAAVPLLVQFLGPDRPTGRLVPGDFVVADAGAILVPASRQLLRLPGITADPWSVVTEDSGAYLGIAVLLLLLVAWQRFRTPAVAAAVPVVLLTCVLALGPHLHLGGTTTPIPLPWIVVDRLPLLENLDPARFMVLAWLGIATVVAVGADHALRRNGRERVRRLALLAVALATVLPAGPPRTAAVFPDYLASADASTIPSGDVVLITPVSDGSSLRVLLWQADAGLRWRMVTGNAYGKGRAVYYTPSTLTDTLAAIEAGAPVTVRDSVLTVMRNDLARLRIGTVIESGGARSGAELALLTRLLGDPSTVDGDVHVWHDVRALLSQR
jgi:hypothetical protein